MRDNFDRDQRGIEDAVGQEEQRDRNGDRREPVAEGTVDDGRAERDEGECELVGVHHVVGGSQSCVFVASLSTAAQFDVERSFGLVHGVTLPILAPVDLQLAHAGAQRVRIDPEQPRRAVRPFDSAVGRLERRLDVPSDHDVERLDARRRRVAAIAPASWVLMPWRALAERAPQR